MKEMRLQYSVPMMCRVYKVSASGYYAHITRPISKRAHEDRRLKIEIKAAHRRTRRVCGAEWICDGRTDNEEPGKSVIIPGSGSETSGEGADTSFRSRQPVLCSGLPETA